MAKKDIIKFNDELTLTLSYNVFEGENHYFIKGDFGNGLVLSNPYLIAIMLLNLPNEFLEKFTKELNNKKVTQYFKNEIPYEHIMFELTGGDEVWTKIKWDFVKAMEYWKDDVDDLLKDCKTLYDLLISFKYLKNEIIFTRFNDFLNYLK